MESLVKPATVVDRVREWQLLTDFLADPAPAMRLGVVSGRRRHGKSYLLRALVDAAGGFYFTAAREEGRVVALRRFARAVAEYAGLEPDSLEFADWNNALTNAVQVCARRGGHRLMVLDELPYLLDHSREIPGILQLLYDDDQQYPRTGVRLILCGSAISVMHEILSGAKALRGRAVVDLRLTAFDYRTSRAFWGIDDPMTALQVDSALGGAPGYQPLAGRPSPNDGFERWLAGTMLNPGRAVYSRTETDYLLREEPRITQSTVYYDILTAIAQGAHTQSNIGGALGKPRTALTHPLETLESAGFIRRDQDVLRRQHPTITLADPVIRFNQLITLPMTDALEEIAIRSGPDRDLLARQIWQTSAPTYRSKILGPHFETLCRTWVRTYGTDQLGGFLGPVGGTEIPDQQRKTKHEVDVIALRLGARPQSPRTSIALIGEAKATVIPRAIGDLERLEYLRTLLADSGHDTAEAVLTLFSLHGFQPDLQRVAAGRPDVLLVDLPMLYGV